MVITNIGAMTGALAAMITAWIIVGKPDIGMLINGLLAGLVAITAPCAFVTMTSGAIIGAIAGVLVVFLTLLLDKLKIDDPVGALPVHLGNGLWGTLALGIFYNNEVATKIAALPTNLGAFDQTIVQLKGMLIVGVFVFAASAIVWAILKYTLGIRVGKEEEIEGLDIGEHGNEAYPDFQPRTR
jgi:Amt family ammonium transporter